MYEQVSHSRILYGAIIVFMCVGRISEQTVTFALYNINRLVLYNQRWKVFIGQYALSLYIKQKHLAIKWLNYKPKSKSKVNLLAASCKILCDESKFYHYSTQSSTFATQILKRDTSLLISSAERNRF